MAAKRPSRRPPGPAQTPRTITLARQATALTIAGSDPSGGAGLQADLKVFQQLGVYGMSVVTLLTVQNTCEVRQVMPLDPALVEAQLDAVLEDIPPRAIKTGALGSPTLVRRIAARLQSVKCPIIVDPVLVSKHGHALADDATADAYREHLLPLATLITPNRHETERLTGVRLRDPDSADTALEAFQKLGVAQALIKAGPADGMAVHWLSRCCHESQTIEQIKLTVEWLQQTNTHGSGCVLSAIITALFALGATEIRKVVERAIPLAHMTIAIQSQLGRGIQPVETRALPPFGVDR